VNSLLEIVLDKIFDYAGEYPPASEPFLHALTLSGQFKEILKRPNLVGADLVTDVEHLQILSTINLNEYNFHPGQDFRVCFLGLEGEFQDISAFNRVGADGVRRIISAFEIKGTPTVEQKSTIPLAYEPDLSLDNWQDNLSQVLKFPNIILKIRANGPRAISMERLADVIMIATEKNAHLKITGEHHHPIIEKDLYNNKFGFLNFILAVLFSRVLGGKNINVLSFLENTDPLAFRFEEDQISYDSFAITKAELIKAKNSAHLSIGSCSLTEPDDDLYRLFGEPAL
jgi:hypothetical protein